MVVECIGLFLIVPEQLEDLFVHLQHAICQSCVSSIRYLHVYLKISEWIGTRVTYMHAIHTEKPDTPAGLHVLCPDDMVVDCMGHGQFGWWGYTLRDPLTTLHFKGRTKTPVGFQVRLGLSHQCKCHHCRAEQS